MNNENKQTYCDDCIHSRLCKFKDELSQFYKKEFLPLQESLKTNDFFEISAWCKHRKTEPMVKQSVWTTGTPPSTVIPAGTYAGTAKVISGKPYMPNPETTTANLTEDKK